MPSTYTVEAVYPKSVWDNDPNKGDYPADLKGFDQGPVALFHDSSGNFDPPKVGDEVFGDIAKDKRGQWRLKRATRAKGDGGGGKSPDQQRSIVRQHSQEMALRFIAMTGDAKDMNFGDPTVVSAYLSETVKRLTDWFANDAMAAPKPPQSASNGAPPPEVPADTAGLTPAPAGVSDDVPF